MSFKQHLLTEAFKEKSMPSIVSKVVNIISKRIGQRFYPYNKNGYQLLKADGKSYSGYLFFMQSLKAVRFNTLGGKFDSIEIWNRYTIGSKSDFTIRLDGMNIVKIINDISDIIKKPSVGVFHVKESEEFEGETLEEAKHVKDPHEFHHLGIKTFGMNKDHSKLSWDDVQHIATSNDVRVPGWVRNSKKGSGHNATYSIVPDTHISGATAGAKPDKDYFIKVSPRDNTTNKFVSVKDDAEAQRLTSLIKAAVDAPKTQELKNLARDPNSIFNKMTSLITLVVKGVRPAVFIYGGPGTGKTFVSLECLKNLGLHKNRDFFYQSGGKVSPAELYRLLFMHRNAGEILVFDDMDSVFDNDVSSNILKAALDSKPEREISWSSNRTVNVSKWSDDTREAYEKKIDAFLRGEGSESEEEEDDDSFDDDDHKKKEKKEKQPERLPSKFTYRGKVIFISNLPASKVDKAVMNRAYQIDMTLTEEEMIARIRHLLPLILKEIPDHIKEEALAAVIKSRHMDEIDYISIRTFEEASKVANSGLPNWRELIPHV